MATYAPLPSIIKPPALPMEFGDPPKPPKPDKLPGQQTQDPGPPQQPVVNSNPYVTNPFAPHGSQWATWQQPSDATVRAYYTQDPRSAYQQFQNAWGAPNGNLQKFMDSQFGQMWADYIRQTQDPTKLDLQFTDTLTPNAGNQLQQQWQGQTPYQRGENYASMGAGRRV